jgi:hypothetical protein
MKERAHFSITITQDTDMTNTPDRHIGLGRLSAIVNAGQKDSPKLLETLHEAKLFTGTGGERKLTRRNETTKVLWTLKQTKFFTVK